MDNKELEMAKEIARINLEKNIPVRILLEKYEKGSIPATTQGKEHTNKINEIIPPGVDLDNGEIYDIETGVTIRGLEDGF